MVLICLCCGGCNPPQVRLTVIFSLEQESHGQPAAGCKQGEISLLGRSLALHYEDNVF